MAIAQANAANFEQITDAARNGRLALMEVTEKASGKKVEAICLMNFDGEEVEFIPVALMPRQSVKELVDPPEFGESNGN